MSTRADIHPSLLRGPTVPAPKTFWQQLRETSARGDALDANASFASSDPSSPWSFFSAFFSPSFLKLAFATYFARTAAHVVEAEVDALGLTDLRKGLKDVRTRAEEMGLGPKGSARSRGMRAELWMPGLNLR